MRLLACLVGLLCVVSVAQAGRNANGTLFVHTSNTYNYCTSQVCTAAEANLGSCEEANTMATREAGQVVWLFAFWCPPASPGVTVVYFGIDYDDATLDPGAAYKLCGPAGSLEVPDGDWPYTGRGNSVAFGSPVYGTIFPFYVFKIDGGTDGSYFGTSINPTGGYAGFVDDSNPPLIDNCYNFGTIRWNTPGMNSCPGCGVPPGACCFPDCHCELLQEQDCYAMGGSFLGVGVPCDPNPCSCPPGACCYPDGTCTILPDYACAESGGSFQGIMTVCSPNPCPQPGACCFADCSCQQLLEPDCVAAGGVFMGAGVSCQPNPCSCPPIGACCLPDGSCVETLESECLAQGGLFQGFQVPCAPDLCPPTATRSTTWGRVKAVYR